MRILIVTDIHERGDMIDLLHKRLNQEQHLEFDLVICCGDLLNINHPPPGREPRDDGQNQADEECFDVIIEDLSRFSAKVYYLPGNHDPAGRFIVNGDTNSGRPGINLHRRSAVIGPGLRIAGVGGSTNGYYRTPNDSGKIRLAYAGFPYDREEELAGHLEELGKELSDGQECCLFITHAGPSGAGTTDVDPDPLVDAAENSSTRIESGSRAIREWAMNNWTRCKLVGLVHGHSHQPWGICQLGRGCTVLNPGPLRDGQYAVLELSADERNWRISSYTLGQLCQ